MSSAWLPEVLSLFGRAYEWLQENAEPDISEQDGKQYGWKFKA